MDLQCGKEYLGFELYSTDCNGLRQIAELDIYHDNSHNIECYTFMHMPSLQLSL